MFTPSNRDVNRWTRAGVLLTLGCLVFTLGCPTVPPTVTPVPVLTGDWLTTLASLTELTFTFDEDGVLTEITGVTDEDVTVEYTVTGASSTQNGDTITFQFPVGSGTITFQGTLSEDENEIVGSFSGQFAIGDATQITIPSDELTLRREGTTPPPSEQELNFPTSLHATRKGKETFYAGTNGFFNLTDVAYSTLACNDCHAATLADGTAVDAETYEPSCADCHADPENPTSSVADSICLGCHSRQANEQNLFDDVHRTAGFTCMSCHTSEEMHGDGEEYDSLLDTVGPQCEDCHSEDGEAGAPPSNAAHGIHGATVNCSACHVKSVIACYNCHFESEVAGAGKRFLTPPFKDFKMLVNFRGQVHPATFQALVYDQQTFYAIAPYYAHTVTAEVDCDDCHGNAAVTEYADTGNISVATIVGGELQRPSGVIPVPPDYATALLFDFYDYTGDPETPIAETDPNLWQFLKRGPDLTQMLYGTPLTADQMDSLTD